MKKRNTWSGLKVIDRKHRPQPPATRDDIDAELRSIEKIKRDLEETNVATGTRPARTPREQQLRHQHLKRQRRQQQGYH